MLGILATADRPLKLFTSLSSGAALDRQPGAGAMTQTEACFP